MSNAKASGRTHWLDEKTDTPLIDEYVKKLGSFLEAMADGKIDASELKGAGRTGRRADEDHRARAERCAS